MYHLSHNTLSNYKYPRRMVHPISVGSTSDPGVSFEGHFGRGGVSGPKNCVFSGILLLK